MACASETHLKHTFTREIYGGQTFELEQESRRENCDDDDDDDVDEKGIHINKLMEC